jgi:hypothetical protein
VVELERADVAVIAAPDATASRLGHEQRATVLGSRPVARAIASIETPDASCAAARPCPWGEH